MADRVVTMGNITMRWRMDAVTDLPTEIEIQNASTRTVAILTIGGRAMKVRPGLSGTAVVNGLWSWEDQPHYGNVNDLRRVLVGPAWSLTRFPL